MLLERDEIPDGSRTERRKQPDAGDRNRGAGYPVDGGLAGGQQSGTPGVDQIEQRRPLGQRVDHVAGDDTAAFGGVVCRLIGGESHEPTIDRRGPAEAVRCIRISDARHSQLSWRTAMSYPECRTTQLHAPSVVS